MSVDELRGQISVLLRKIDLLERQGVERETEVLKLKEEVRGLRQHNAELLEKLQPPGKRERALVARLNSLAEYAESIQRELRAAPKPAAAARGNGGGVSPRPALPQAPLVRPRALTPAPRPRSLTPAPAPPAVLWGARWEPSLAGPDRVVWLRVNAPGFEDGTLAVLSIQDEHGDRDEAHEATVEGEEVVIEWLTPRLPGRFTFRAEAAGKGATAGWLTVDGASGAGLDPDEAALAREAAREVEAERAEAGPGEGAEPPPAGPLEDAPPADPASGAAPRVRELDQEITDESLVAGAAGAVASGAESAAPPARDPAPAPVEITEAPTRALIDLPPDFSRAPAAAEAAAPAGADPATSIYVPIPPPRKCRRCTAALKPEARYCETCGQDSAAGDSD